MAKGRRRAPAEDPGVEDPAPLEAGLVGPAYGGSGAALPEGDELPDDYLLLKVVEANGEHLRTMRWGLGLGMLVLLGYVAFGAVLRDALGGLAAGLAVFLVAGLLLGVGLHALARQLDLLRRATAATDHFLFGDGDHDGHGSHGGHGGHGHGPPRHGGG